MGIKLFACLPASYHVNTNDMLDRKRGRNVQREVNYSINYFEPVYFQSHEAYRAKHLSSEKPCLLLLGGASVTGHSVPPRFLFLFCLLPNTDTTLAR